MGQGGKRLASSLQEGVRLNERQKFKSRELLMSIQKKSLISTLKKANVAREDFAGSAVTKSPLTKSPIVKQLTVKNAVAKN